MIRRVRKAKKEWPAELHLVRKWYEPYLPRLYDDPKPECRIWIDWNRLRPGMVRETYFFPNWRSIRRTQLAAGRMIPCPMKITRSCPPSIRPKVRSGRIVRILNVVEGGIPSQQGRSG